MDYALVFFIGITFGSFVTIILVAMGIVAKRADDRSKQLLDNEVRHD